MIEAKVLLWRLPYPLPNRLKEPVSIAPGAVGNQSAPIVARGAGKIGNAEFYEQDECVYVKLTFYGERENLGPDSFLQRLPTDPVAARDFVDIAMRRTLLKFDIERRLVTQIKIDGIEVAPRNDPDAWRISEMLKAREEEEDSYR